MSNSPKRKSNGYFKAQALRTEQNKIKKAAKHQKKIEKLRQKREELYERM